MKKLEKAKISLDDCLACSGCVTSAETVLITQQSHEELRKVLGANKVSGGPSSDATLTQHPHLLVLLLLGTPGVEALTLNFKFCVFAKLTRPDVVRL